MTSLPIVFVCYGTILAAELVGDKSLYTLGAVGSRYRIAPILLGATLAFALKMLAAVLVGDVIAKLPAWVVAGLSAVSFFGMAWVLFRKRAEVCVADVATPHWSRAVLAGFAGIFFSEWADVGQITAALMAARFHAPVAVWAGGTLAMITKGGIGCTLGIGLRRWVPQRALRTVSASMCVILGALSMLRVD